MYWITYSRETRVDNFDLYTTVVEDIYSWISQDTISVSKAPSFDDGYVIYVFYVVIRKV